MTNMSLDSSNDGGEVPTASLQEILDNDENIHKSARLSRKDRNSIALYLKVFHLDAQVLDEKYSFGVDAVREIQSSRTYQGFVCAIEGKKYRDNPANTDADIRSLDYKIGYETGMKVSQRRRRA